MYRNVEKGRFHKKNITIFNIKWRKNYKNIIIFFFSLLFLLTVQNDLIKSLGIINDEDNTIKLDNLMIVVHKHLFDNKEETDN